MELTGAEVRHIIGGVIVLIVSVAVHEFGHAIVATWLGDDTPRRQGRVTLNPLAHADPIGTLALPLIGGIITHGAGGGFGWGKPVQWQPRRIRRGISMSTANILVSAAGPFMNAVLGTLIALVHVILVWRGVIATHDAKGEPTEINEMIEFASRTNFILMFFNLLPIPPLDGGHILEALLPYRLRGGFAEIAKFGAFIVMAFAFIPQLAQVFVRPASFCLEHVYALFAHLFHLGG